MAQLNRIKQGITPFNKFLNNFNRTILEAEGWQWDNKIKKGFLKAAIITRLITATIGILKEPLYKGYYSQLQMVNDQLMEVAEITS